MSQLKPWQHRLHEVIFEADTRAGKAFDVALLVMIVLSVLVVILESVEGLALAHAQSLRRLEWGFTILFTIEYALRIFSIGRPKRYILSTYGVIDLLAIIPTYLSLIFVGSQSLLVIRALRLLRVFRVLKLARFVGAASMLGAAMRASVRKIIVFLFFVITLMVIIGAVMYMVEGKSSGFDNIPLSIYWTVVTMTTVGYGDIAPQTVLGRILASIVMILGYGIIAVPTGIVTVEMAQGRRAFGQVSTQACEQCAAEGHDADARHCKHCGALL
jgi:voltage-gated potassium channel